MMIKMGQKSRLFILIVYVISMFGVSKIALGVWVPPTDNKGLWFYSGLAALLLGSLIETPFYTPPKDALSNAISAIIALQAVNVWNSSRSTGFDRYLWLSVVIFSISILITSVLSITLKDFSGELVSKLSKSATVFTSTLGKPNILFSVIYLFALVTFHRNDPREYLPISLAWVIFVGIKPLETIEQLISRWINIFRNRIPSDQLGFVVGHQSPGIVLICQENDTPVNFGDAILVRADDGRNGLAMALDYVGFVDGRWLRALQLNMPSRSRAGLNLITKAGDADTALAYRVNMASLSFGNITDKAWLEKNQLIGLVAPDTDLSHLRIEIIRTDIDLHEGQLVTVQIGLSEVMYQLINGLTREEILQQKNTRGYVRADAKKIGRWNDADQQFEPVKWLPNPNSSVYSTNAQSSTPLRDAIGFFPNTNYSVKIKDIDSLVTHNAAILGILGIGKTYLAAELVERMIENGTKIICLDLTDQYSNLLNTFYNKRSESRRIQVLKSVGPPGRTSFKQNVEEGGSVGIFRNYVRRILERFLDPNVNDCLVIYNPEDFEVWRQDSKMFKGTASMASLTPAEVTRIFTETTLEILRDHGMSDKAKCCIVFEEAHSLIPEWNSVVYEGDKTATNGTTRAILQGRKYGLGCLLVTQRTANVTKSILNQCNTVFALRVYDSTGMEFLRNYIGEDYSSVLSTLEDRHCVIFGRASSCSDPVLIKLNERQDFIRVFRSTNQNSN